MGNYKIVLNEEELAEMLKQFRVVNALFCNSDCPKGEPVSCEEIKKLFYKIAEKLPGQGFAFVVCSKVTPNFKVCNVKCCLTLVSYGIGLKPVGDSLILKGNENADAELMEYFGA